MILFSTSLAETMSDNEFNANQARAFRIPGRSRPDGVGYQSYKNRFRVSSKLTEVNWMAFRAFLAKTDRSPNDAINYLVATHPEVQNNA